MDARLVRCGAFSAALLLVLASTAFPQQVNRGHRTRNFIVSAATPQLAKQIAEHAEMYRKKLAIEWTGRELAPWRHPCPIRAKVSPQLGAGGVTSFSFAGGEPMGWSMEIQGSHERVLDSVLPHEVTHTIFATHFGCPLPRWADEGACTTVEHQSERSKHERMLIYFLTHGKGIPFNKMFAMREYPPEMLPLYAQGYSLTRYLLQHGGRQKFVAFVGDGMQSNNWDAVMKKHYGFQDLSQLQVTWVEWVRQGSPKIEQPQQVAAASAHAQTEPEMVAVPTQSPRANSAGLNAKAASAADANASPTPVAHELASAETPVQPSRQDAEGGWYVKQRDLAAAEQSQAVNATVTRPQPMGRAQPRILQSSSANGYAPGSVQPGRLLR